MSIEARSPERLRHHFEVERELANRLRNSTRQERTALFKTLYTELFQRVPDHPRLTGRDDLAVSAQYTESQLKLFRHLLKPDTVFLEFAPGDCRLSFAVAELVKKVIGVDISDQRAATDTAPKNFDLIVYDGYQLAVPDQSVDMAFSYQFLEHLHPDDVDAHFDLVHRILKPGGVYIFSTPHGLSGPHDISAYFARTSECFHFHEWTYGEMIRLLHRHGFEPCQIFYRGRLNPNGWFANLVIGIEKILALLPYPARHFLARRSLLAVSLAAYRK